MKNRVVALALCIAFGASSVGCGSATTAYTPRFVARGELTLRYDDGVQIYAGKKHLTDAPSFGGLTHYVRCVASARQHAEAAEADGSAAIGLGVAGSVVGVAGLGGLAGLAFLEDDKALAFGLLGTGVAVGLVGMTMALFSRSLKNSANGHAVDAVNFYNDEVGFYGGGCHFEKRPAPASEVPKEVVVPAAVPESAGSDHSPPSRDAAESEPHDPEDGGTPDPDAAPVPKPVEPAPRSVDSVLDG